MSSSTFNVRMDDKLRAEATEILADYGLSPTQAVKLFFNQVVQTKKVPLRFDYKTDEPIQPIVPNEATRLAILEAKQDYLAGKLASYQTVDDAINAMAELTSE